MTDDELRDHFSRIDQRFDQIDHRFDGMQAQIDERFDGVYEVLKAQGNAIARLDARVTGLEEKVDAKLDSIIGLLTTPTPRRVETGRPYPQARTAKGGQ